MRKVLAFSILLIVGLLASQLLGGAIASVPWAGQAIQLATMTALSFIMIHVGYEFEIDKSRLGSYGWDAVVAGSAAALPWLLTGIWFVFAILPSDLWSDRGVWSEALLASAFAAPTSAGVLFSMLFAAGLGTSWLFHKVRVLAIFDDLGTVLLLIPLKIALLGFKFELLIVVAIMVGLLWAAYRWLHQVRLPTTWKWLVVYSILIVAASEEIHLLSKWLDFKVPIHIEVLLPAFALGCMLARPNGPNAPAHDAAEGHDVDPAEARASTVISGLFMVLVGLSMPPLMGGSESAAGHASTEATANALRLGTPALGWGLITAHVLAVTVVSNIGKMIPAFCYRKEASFRERLAVCVGMWPRGEVGAGILVLSLGYGISGPIVTIALLSLMLNLLCTGFFIVGIRRLLGLV